LCQTPGAWNKRLYKTLKRAAARTTITRGGARTERLSAWNEVFASRSAFCRHAPVFRADFYTPKDIPSWFWFSHVSPANHPAQNFIGPVGAIVAGICYQLIGVFASLLLAAVSARIRRGEIILSSIAFRAPNPVDRFISRFGCVPRPSVGDQPVARRKVPVDIQGPGGLIGYRLSDEHRGLLPVALGPVGSVLLVVANLFDHADFGYGFAPDSSCSRDGQPCAPERGEAGRMASAAENSEVGSHRTTQDSKATGDRSKRYRGNLRRKGFLCLNL